MLNVVLKRYASSDAFLESRTAVAHARGGREQSDPRNSGRPRERRVTRERAALFRRCRSEDDVAGCAVRSPPYPLALARCTDSTALELIITDVLSPVSRSEAGWRSRADDHAVRRTLGGVEWADVAASEVDADLRDPSPTHERSSAARADAGDCRSRSPPRYVVARRVRE
jgi:hypothetical protein